METYLQSLDLYSWQIISLLIFAGLLVGIINTLAGSGTAITYSLFMLMGLSPAMANGTPRLGVIMQTLAASVNFYKGGKLPILKGTKLGIAVTLGSIGGAQIAVSMDQKVFSVIVAWIMLMMLVFLFYKPEQWIQGKAQAKHVSSRWWHYIIYFIIGAYGGFIHIGVGIFLLAALVLISGYDLVEANGIKVYTVFMYSPFALVVFMANGQVDYAVGLISAIGNLIGGIWASKYALRKGSEFVRWVLVVVLIFFSTRMLGLHAWLWDQVSAAF